MSRRLSQGLYGSEDQTKTLTLHSALGRTKIQTCLALLATSTVIRFPSHTAQWMEHPNARPCQAGTSLPTPSYDILTMCLPNATQNWVWLCSLFVYVSIPF